MSEDSENELTGDPVGVKKSDTVGVATGDDEGVDTNDGVTVLILVSEGEPETVTEEVRSTTVAVAKAEIEADPVGVKKFDAVCVITGDDEGVDTNDGVTELILVSEGEPETVTEEDGAIFVADAELEIKADPVGVKKSDTVGVTTGDDVNEDIEEGVDASVLVIEKESETDAEEVGTIIVAVAKAEIEADPVGVTKSDTVGVKKGDDVLVPETVTVNDATSPVAVTDAEDTADDEGVKKSDMVGVAAGDDVSVNAAERLSVLMPVLLGDSETDEEDEAVSAALAVEEPTADGVKDSIPEGVADSMDDEDSVNLAENDRELVPDIVGELEADPVRVTRTVVVTLLLPTADADTDSIADRVAVTAAVDVGDSIDDDEPDSTLVTLCELDGDPVEVVLTIADALAEKTADADTDSIADSVGVSTADDDGVVIADKVTLLPPDTEGEMDTAPVDEILEVIVCDPDDDVLTATEALSVLLVSPDALKIVDVDGLNVLDCVVVVLSDVTPEALNSNDIDGLSVVDTLDEAFAEIVLFALCEGIALLMSLVVAVTEPVVETVALGVLTGETVSCMEAEEVPDKVPSNEVEPV
jgi:hypothetical protein